MTCGFLTCTPLAALAPVTQVSPIGLITTLIAPSTEWQLMKSRSASSMESTRELRNRFATDPDFVKLALENVKASKLPRVTQALLRALIYRLDPGMTLEVNDALDIAHCIVPAAYADFVLLDRRWYLRLKDAQDFLRSVGIETRIAEQYTRRDSGVLKLLERLEAWPAKDITRPSGG